MLIRKNVKTLLRLFKIMEEFYGKENFYTAIYIYVRYGLDTFNNDINSKKLKKINEELEKQKTLFDEDLGYRTDKILNDEK